MTTIAPDPSKLRELDEDTARAWQAYLERLAPLSGEDYERTEHESWTALQDELGRLERRRDLLSTPTS